MGFVLLVRESVRRYFGARVAYGLWLIPAARLLMPTLTRTVERPAEVETPAIMATPHFPFSLVPTGSWQTWIIALWITGALAMFIVRMTQFARQRSAILRISRQIDTVGSVRIITATEVRGPIAFGLFDRVIALPIDFETRYNEHERVLALEHELAHHRSGDLIANFGAFVLLCLQWFNPLAWVAYSAFRFDQEAACDARVLDEASHKRADYARAIAKAASGREILFASALDRRSVLQRRLKCMLRPPPAAHGFVGRLAIAAALAAALPLTATRAIDYVDVPASKESSVPHQLSSPRRFTPNGNSMKSAAAVAPTALAEPERANSRRDRAADAAYAQAELKMIRLEADDAARAQRDRAEARADIRLAQRDEEQRRRDVEQAQTDEREARMDADRTRQESEPTANLLELSRELLRAQRARSERGRRSSQLPNGVKDEENRIFCGCGRAHYFFRSACDCRCDGSAGRQHRHLCCAPDGVAACAGPVAGGG
jgi:beta-lactamase regulating signal transducer with metallopeptidase domain